MNQSRNKLNEIINLYLNDISDYHSEDFILAESVLKPIK